MSTTETTIEETKPIEETPPPVNGEAKEPPRDAKPPPKRKPDEGEDPAVRGSAKLSRPLQELQTTEDQALADWIRSLGVGESDIKIAVARTHPETAVDPKTGRVMTVKGHLQNYSTFIDEEFIQQAHGGGKYQLTIKRKSPKGGGYDYVKGKTIDIAGDPRTDNLPRIVVEDKAQAAPAASTAEPPSVVMKAMDIMRDELEAQRSRPLTSPPQDTDALRAMFQSMIDSLGEQLQKRDAELAQMRQALIDARNVKPAEDPFREQMLRNLLDGDSQRVQQIRLSHETEIRTLKENQREEERRIRDAADRDKAYLLQAHERELATMKTSHEIALSAAKTSYEVNIKVLEQRNHMLDRELDQMRTELKELRAKKEKTLVEQVKDIQTIKEALDIDGDGKEQGLADKFADFITNPEAIHAVGSVIRGPGAAPPQAAPAAAAQQPARKKREIVKSNGQAFVRETDGSLVPVKRRPVAETGEIPQLPADQVQRAVGLLETAFRNGQDPNVVASSAKGLVSNEILQALLEIGPDVFMSKVANLQPGSPLANQEGRNWVRKVAKALAG